MPKPNKSLVVNTVQNETKKQVKAELSFKSTRILDSDKAIPRDKRLTQKKVAIVYDWIDKWGGAERVLIELYKIFPDAEFYTSYYNSKTAQWAKNLKIHTSFMQGLPTFMRTNRWLSAPFYPFAFESFDFSAFDLVISVTSSYAKSIITRPETKHICYLLTPTRFLWSETKSRTALGILNRILTPYFNFLKKWDYITARRPDKYLTISKTVQKRAWDTYHLDSKVIYPPFDEHYWIKFKKTKDSSIDMSNSNYFLVVSRLEPYKYVDLAVSTFNKLNGEKLIIIGKGSQENFLRGKAKGNIKFVKDVTDMELATLYQNANALIMTQEEDFGYTSLEAQYFGCPVIAFAKGGASETVVNNKTGILFNEQTPQSLQSAIETYGRIKNKLRKEMQVQGHKTIEKFSKIHFVNQIKSNAA